MPCGVENMHMLLSQKYSYSNDVLGSSEIRVPSTSDREYCTCVLMKMHPLIHPLCSFIFRSAL